jgi:transposase
MLESLLRRGKESARSQMHARILLKTDQEPGWTDQQIAEALDIGTATVERVRRRFVEGGLLNALVRRPQPERPDQRKMDGELEARLVTLACSQAEEGRERWTLRVTRNKRTQALAKEAVLYSARSQRRIRLSHGRRAGGVSTSL